MQALLGFKPFKARPKQIDYDKDQYEYIRMQKSKKMTIKMCQIFQHLNQQSWNINDRKFSIQQYKLITSLIKQCQSVSIHILQNQSPKITQIITQPYFNHLYQLAIVDTKIDNLEILQFINAPLLNILMLHNNYITNLQPFKKIKFNQLQCISLHFNFINSSQQLKTLQRFVNPQLKNQKLINIINYIYPENQPYQQFEYNALRLQTPQNIPQQGEQFIPIQIHSHNQFYANPKLKSQLVKKMANIPFLVKTNLPNQINRRPKIKF